MAQVVVDTVAYPSWWAAATTVRLTWTQAATGTGAQAIEFPRADAEMLPQGVSVAGNTNTLVPWSAIQSLSRVN